MTPNFWKLSHGTNHFSKEEISQSIENRLVYVHRDTRSKGRSYNTQGEDFVGAPVGDYFYMTYGNQGIYLLGQFSGPTNLFSTKGHGWLDRPYRIIRMAIPNTGYQGDKKWWTPNDNSTFTRVPERDITVFEGLILQRFFGLTLANYGL